jgi:hypothetical protein
MGYFESMSEEPPSVSQPYLPVLSFTEGLGESLFHALGLGEGDEGVYRHQDLEARLELFRLHVNPPEGLQPVLKRANAVLLLVRFMDRTSIEQVRDAYRLVVDEAFLPKTLLILRESGEHEFKISCAYCGQKLWVRDRDAGKRGNCPQCRKTFFLPTQKSYLTSYLMLTDAVPVHQVVLEEKPCQEAMDAFLGRLLDHEQGLKSSTARVRVPPDQEV